MVWDGTNKDVILKARRDLLAVQRTDGRVDLASIKSGALTASLAMMALQGSGCRFPTRRTSGAFNTY